MMQMCFWSSFSKASSVSRLILVILRDRIHNSARSPLSWLRTRPRQSTLDHARAGMGQKGDRSDLWLSLASQAATRPAKSRLKQKRKLRVVCPLIRMWFHTPQQGTSGGRTPHDAALRDRLPPDRSCLHYYTCLSDLGIGSVPVGPLVCFCADPSRAGSLSCAVIHSTT